MSTGKYSPVRYKANQLRSEVLRLRLQGLSHEQIGRALGVSKQRVGHIYKRAFVELRTEMLDLAQDNLHLELARLDQMLQKLWSETIQTQAGEDVKGRTARNVEVILKLMERRAKYLGLDAPEKRVEVSMTAGLKDMTVEELGQELERMGFRAESMPVPEQLPYVLPGELPMPALQRASLVDVAVTEAAGAITHGTHFTSPPSTSKLPEGTEQDCSVDST